MGRQSGARGVPACGHAVRRGTPGRRRVAPGAFLQSSVSAMLLAGRRDRHEPDGLPPTVFIIDDDADARVSIAELLRSVGLRAEVFASAPGVPGPRAGSRAELPRARPQAPRDERPRHPARARPHGHVDPDHLHHGSRRYPDHRAGHEMGIVEFLTKPSAIRCCLTPSTRHWNETASRAGGRTSSRR